MSQDTGVGTVGTGVLPREASSPLRSSEVPALPFRSVTDLKKLKKLMLAVMQVYHKA